MQGRKFWLLLSVSGLIWLFWQKGWMLGIVSEVERVSLPVREKFWGKASETGSQAIPEDVGKSLVAEVGRLTEENEALREQLKVAEEPRRVKVLAHVVGRGQGELRLDQGETVGVIRGKVVVFGQALIGRIEETNRWGSRVVLPTSGKFAMVAVVRGAVSGAKRADGLVVGKGGKVRLIKILRDDDLAFGDTVETVGGEGEPAGLLVGKVGEVFETSGIYKEAEIEPPVKFDNLLSVFVLID